MKNKEKSKITYLSELNTNLKYPFGGIIAQFLTCYMVFLGLILSFATSLNMMDRLYYSYFITATFVLLLVSTVIFASYKIYLPFLGVVAILGGVFYKFVGDFFKTLADAIDFLYNLGLDIITEQGYTYYEQFKTSDVSYIIEDTVLVDKYFYCTTIFLMVIFSIIFAVFAIKRCNLLIPLISSIILLSPGFFIGIVPAAFPFILFLSGFLGIYIVYLTKYSSKPPFKFKNIFKKENFSSKMLFNHAKTGGIYGLFISIIICIVSSLISFLIYSVPIIEFEKFRDTLDSAASYAFNMMFYSTLENSDTNIGGIFENDLMKIKTPKLHDVPVMTVNSHTNKTIYLKSHSSYNYDSEDGWSLNDKYFDGIINEIGLHDQFSINAQRYNFLYNFDQSMLSDFTTTDTEKFGYIYDEITIKANFKKSLIAHQPFSPTAFGVSGGIKTNLLAGDVLSFDKKRPSGNVYTISGLLPVMTNYKFLDNFDNYINQYLADAEQYKNEKYETLNTNYKRFCYDERKYAEFVNENYTQPYEDVYGLNELVHKITDKYPTKLEKVQAIERYLRKNYTYTLQNNENTTNDTLQIINFLFDNKKGTCAHFSSSFVFMLRELNIPSRIGVGYISPSSTAVESNNIFKRTVMDKNYHSWTEVYFDGIGWLIFDATPSSVNGQNNDYYLLDKIDHPEKYQNTSSSVKDDGVSNEETQIIYHHDSKGDGEGLVDTKDDNYGFWFFFFNTIIKYLWLIITVFVIILIFVILYFVSRNRYKKLIFNIENEENEKSIRYSNYLVLTLLKLSKLQISPGERPADYAKRVDNALLTDIKYSAVLPIFNEFEFSKNSASDEQKTLAKDFAFEISKKLLLNKNFFKRNYLKFRLKIRGDKIEK